MKNEPHSDLANSEFRFLPLNEQISFSFAGQYAPTFRSCFAYFARLDENGGFLSHDTQYKQQKEWDITVKFFKNFSHLQNNKLL